MAKTRRDAGLMAAAGVVLLLLGLAMGLTPVTVIGVLVLVWGGIQWLMFANRDIHRQPPQD